MADYNFVSNNPEEIRAEVLSSLNASCGETLYPGDERFMFGEGVAALQVTLNTKFNDQARQRMLRYARGVVLDYLGEFLGVYRLQASPAYATFRFTVSAVQTTNIVIPQGTRITADGSVYFATDENAVLQAGDTYVDVDATCQTAGSAYNDYSAGSVATLVDLIPYIQSVSNTTATTGGDDGEPYTTEGDNRFRNRIQMAPATRTTAGPKASYEYYAMSADPDIIDVYVECPEDEPTVVNIYTLMSGGEPPDADALAKVQAACSPDDVRPMTDKVTAKKPTQKSYDINIKYYTTAADEAAVIAAVEDDGGAIDQYIEWQCGELGRDINPDELRKFVLVPGDDKVGPYRIDVTSPTYTAVADTEVAKFSGTLTVTHEVV